MADILMERLLKCCARMWLDKGKSLDIAAVASGKYTILILNALAVVSVQRRLNNNGCNTFIPFPSHST